MRWLTGLTVWLLAATATPQVHPTATPRTEVFTGGGDVAAPRERPTSPQTTYWRVQLLLKLKGDSPGSRVQVLLPLSDSRQMMLERHVDAPTFEFREETSNANLWGVFRQRGAEAADLRVDFTAAVADSTDTVPALPLNEIVAPETDPTSLQPSPLMQSNDPKLRAVAESLIGDAQTLDAVAWALFQHVAAFVRTGPGEARQDALTVLHNGSGNSTGKARLLVALLRASHIPARLVGGLKLEDAKKKRATTAWVEIYAGGRWIPIDPGGGYFGWIPNQYLALYHDDLPLIVHSGSVGVDYDFLMHRVRKDPAAARPSAAHTARPPAVLGTETLRTLSEYVERPVASVVVIADSTIADDVTERMLREAHEAEIDLVILHAPFESRYFREQYLQRLISNNLTLIRNAHVLLVATHDDAGLYGLLALGEQDLQLGDVRIVVAGRFRRSAGQMLGGVLQHLIDAGQVVLINRPAGMLGLWEMVRANVLDGVPMEEEGAKWDLQPEIVDARVVADFSPWRRHVLGAWARAVRAQVPLQALTLILVLPVIAAMVVVLRTVVGIETFGVFSPVIVSLAFLTTGLRWGVAIFAVIVGVGATVRTLLQHVRLQLVARLAILIAVVAGIMAGLTVLGAYFGIGPLMNVSIFPMVIMSNMIENFTSSRAEFGTREAVRLTLNTLMLAALCNLVVEAGDLQSVLLTFPELLVAAIVVDVVLGKVRGLRLLEYKRFWSLSGKRAPWNS